MTAPVFEHLKEIGAALGAAPYLLLGLDFDGTLAPIVARPEHAAIPEKTVSILQCLAMRKDITLAIVSGRGLADLKSLVPLDVILAGNHGFEITGQGLDFRHPDAEKNQALLRRICGQLSRRLLTIPGAWVEDKGFTASVHFRSTEESAKGEVSGVVRATIGADNRDIVIRKGDQVLEIRPRVEWDKGSAVRWIRAHIPVCGTAVCYVGDDETDEDVFSVVKGVTIRVGEPDGTAARFFVNGPDEVAKFLEWLLSARRSAEIRPAKENSRPPASLNR